jgi:Domain of unknown function (DUF6851)/VCPO second helical-bundle domain
MFSRNSVLSAMAIVVVLAGSVSGFASGSAQTVVVQWDAAAVQGVRDATPGPPMVARALAIVHTCMFDAWAAYDRKAVGTQLGGTLRRPAAERTQANKQKAVSYAAYRALLDLLPVDKASVYDPLMQSLGYDPNDQSTDTSMPAGIGNVACAAVLAYRHNDGSNQLNGYQDYTGYVPVNAPSTVPVNPSNISDVNHWVPLQYYDANGNFVTPKFVGAQWFKVTPFAMTSPSEFRGIAAVFGPATSGSAQFVSQAQELITLAANLTDTQKMIAEYWANGPRTETPPGHWALFGEFVSERDHHTLDDDVKMFFALSNAIFDASIAAWDAKRAFDSDRPISSIPFLFQGQQIQSWGGPYKGTVWMDGSQWIPYQASTFPTPPFPEYVSGHSTFSAAGAEILKLWTGSDKFGNSATFPAGSSTVEPGMTPAQSVTLSWATFSAAADEAGISRRYGGIHFLAGDYVGRVVGRLVALQAWYKAERYIGGH